MALTDEEFKTCTLYIIRRMAEEKLDVGDPNVIIRWLLDNPMPDQDTVNTVSAREEGEIKQRHIASLKKQIARLEGS